MQTRYNLASALEGAIEAHNLTNVKRFMDEIYASRGDMTSCNKNNETLLHVALRVNFHKAFDLLFEALKDDKSCLSQADTYGNTILHLIAKSGSLKVLNNINTQIELSWFKANYEGQTPFHLIANRNSTDLLAALIKHLPKDANDACNLINYIGDKNDTALSIAKKSGIAENMAMLINHGADITESVSDNKKSFIASLKNNRQLTWEIYTNLNVNAKKSFLHAWRSLLLKNQEDENIKAIYFALVSMQSLKAITQAHLEFNNEVPLMYGENKNEAIPDYILSADFIPPAFPKRVLREKKTEALNKALNNTLNQLCQKIDKQISDLEAEMQSASLKGKVLLGAVLGLGVVLALGGLAALSIGFILLITTGLMSAFVLMLVSILPASVGFAGLLAFSTEQNVRDSFLKEFNRTISPGQSSALRKDINDKLLNKLHELEKNNIASLPVSCHQIRGLENTVSQIAAPQDRKVDEEVSLLTELKDRLEKMVEELTRRGKPITQVVEDEKMEELVVEENNEVIIDLSSSSPALVSRGGMFATSANQYETRRPLLLDDSNDEEYSPRVRNL